MFDALNKSKLILAFCLFVLIGCSAKSGSNSNIAFDKNKAFDFLVKQVDIGPRYPGVDGHEKAAEYIVSQLQLYADKVIVDNFSYKNVKMKNIIARFNTSSPESIILAAHWDTRPFADQEVNQSKQLQPILGANDGASGVAVLLEIARNISIKKPNCEIIMVFFDGEDYGKSINDMFIGSRHFAKTFADIKKVKYGILLDMVGDKNLNIYKEQHSVEAAQNIVDKVWLKANKLGYQKYFNAEIKYAIEDDHLPLIEAGIKCIDIIDFDYAPWHTLDDTTDKCSPDSLEVVGNVVLSVIYDN